MSQPFTRAVRSSGRVAIASLNQRGGSWSVIRRDGTGRRRRRSSPVAAMIAATNAGKGDPMEIQPRKASLKGPAEWFTGDVWLDPIARGEGPPHVRVAAVHFTPGAHTAWHSHALGQTLYVTEGEGR